MPQNCIFTVGAFHISRRLYYSRQSKFYLTIENKTLVSNLETELNSTDQILIN